MPSCSSALKDGGVHRVVLNELAQLYLGEFLDELASAGSRLNRKFFLIHYIADTIVVFVITLSLSWLMAVILLLIKHEPISEQNIRLKMGGYTGLVLAFCFLANKVSVVVRRLNDLAT